MKNKSSEEFIHKVNQERFKKNRDYLMKLVEQDSKLLYWIAWCLDLIDNNKTYAEAKNYIETATDEELEQRIEPLNVKINSENLNGIILDNRFKIIENGKATEILNIENQLNPYPLNETEARSVIYYCAIIFEETASETDSKHYRNIIAPTELWIFPEVTEKRKNTLEVLPIFLPDGVLDYNFSMNGSLFPEKDKPKFDLISYVYFANLGNPNKINPDFLNGDTKASKLALCLYLLDLLFGFEADKNDRLNELKNKFNLSGRLTYEEVEIMDGFELFGQRRYEKGFNEGLAKGEAKGEIKGEEKGIRLGENKKENELITNLVNRLIFNSGNKLTKEEALKQARELLEPLPNS